MTFFTVEYSILKCFLFCAGVSGSNGLNGVPGYIGDQGEFGITGDKGVPGIGYNITGKI